MKGSDKEEDEEFTSEIIQYETIKFDLTFKIIMIGDSGVGKSCLTQQAVHDKFQDEYIVTVGFEFFSFNVKINNKAIKLQIWDTCGQEVYHSLVTNFYRNSTLAILVYSIDDKESFNHIDKWLRELKELSNPDIKVLVVGNKADLENKREVTKEEGEMFCQNYELNYFIETSAKTGYNAHNLFIKAAHMLLQEYEKYPQNYDDIVSNSSYDLSVKSGRSTPKKKNCC